jgi:hypothetical protein
MLTFANRFYIPKLISIKPKLIMKKIYLSLFALFYFVAGFGQTIAITSNPGSSANIVVGGSSYHVSESIYLESEIGASNFTATGTAINNIAFNCSAVGTGSSTIASPNFKIYLKDVSAATTTFAAGAYNITGYTLVYSGAFSYPATGFQSVNLTTTYVRTTGTNLQVLIVRTDNVVHTGNAFSTSNGNTVAGSSAVTCRRYNSATAPVSGTSSLTTTAFRPQIQLKHTNPNDAKVDVLYTLGKMPVPNATPRTDSARITNNGSNTLTNLNVTLGITGANTFSDVQVIPSLAPGASANVVFAPYTFSNEGNNSYAVSVPSDDDNTNNTQTLSPQSINKNTWSYAYGTTAAAGVGFTGASGDFVAKFNTNLATAISQVSVNFFSGGQPYQIGIWDASGAGGSPGTNLYTSATLTSVTGVNVIPINPAPSIAVGNFYVGVRQTGTVNVGFAYQVETPIRGNTFYYTSPSGSTTWTDFAPANSFRFMIEPKLILPIDASVNTFVVPSSTTCQPTPQTYTATLTNTGANTINIGEANVTLKVAGANVYSGSKTNTTALASGALEIINFPNINVSSPGQNFDTLFVALTGDLDKSNDTLKATNTTLNTVINLPLVERYEAANLNIGLISVLTGGTPRNITSLQTGSYTNVDLGGTLQPHGDNKMMLFDNYSGTTTLGIRNRLYSNCISVPTTGANQCSNYQLSFWLSHDNSYTTDLDSVYLNVTTDGGVTWNRILPGYGRVDAAFATPGWKKETVSMNAYAGQTIQIGFEAVGKWGNIIALDDIQFGSVGAGSIILSTAANNAISLTPDCTDFGWTYYIDPADATKPLMAINWDPTNSGANTLAKAGATATIQVDAANFAAENIAATIATYTMKRYWNVNLNSIAMTAPVNVRFFYNKADTASANAAAQAFATANSVAVKTPSWFKTTTGSFVADVDHVRPAGVINPLALTNVNTTGETINGVLYAQFDGISNFSGGTYATGAGLGSVLPVSIEFFKGSKQAINNVLDWKVNCTTEPSIAMSLERSADGRTFRSIQDQIATNARCLQSFNYVDATPLAGYNYYRLKTVTLDGKVKYSSIVVLLNKEKGFELISIVPNPVQNTAILSLTTVKGGKIELSVSDVTGKVISKQSKIVIAGNNPINMNFAALSAGTYIITAVNADGDIKTTRFVKY